MKLYNTINEPFARTAPSGGSMRSLLKCALATSAQPEMQNNPPKIIGALVRLALDIAL